MHARASGCESLGEVVGRGRRGGGGRVIAGIVGIMVVVAMAGLGGCAAPEKESNGKRDRKQEPPILEIKDVETTVDFQEVCVTPEVNEKIAIEDVLYDVLRSRYRKPCWRLVKTDGDLHVYKGHAMFQAETLTDLNRLYTAMERLREKAKNGHVIDFVLQDRTASLEFCSNYVKSSLWTTIRGQTYPCATVELWLPDGTTVSPQLDEKGHWEFRLRIVKDKNWVYGVSRVPEGVENRERAVEKYFRVEVHDSSFEQLTKERFEDLRRKEP